MRIIQPNKCKFRYKFTSWRWLIKKNWKNLTVFQPPWPKYIPPDQRTWQSAQRAEPMTKICLSKGKFKTAVRDSVQLVRFWFPSAVCRNNTISQFVYTVSTSRCQNHPLVITNFKFQQGRLAFECIFYKLIKNCDHIVNCNSIAYIFYPHQDINTLHKLPFKCSLAYNSSH